MAKKDTYQPLKDVEFRCVPCKRYWRASPARVEDWPDDALHPWRYFGPCPDCGDEAEQSSRERGLLRAWRSATGPVTAEGRAAAARNLEGHPTPEESLRTRFNGMKHGLNAKVATYFPAKPDGYAFCKGCDVDRDYCRGQPACMRQTQHFMLHHAAFEQRNPKHLMGIYADFHAALMLTVQQILQTIIADGVTIDQPKTYFDKDGACLVVQYIDGSGRMQQVREIEAHPLFRPLGELISRTGISLGDLGMTGRVIEEDAPLPGRLKAGDGVASLEDFAAKQAKALDSLKGLLERGKQRANADPVLLEYQEQMGGEDGGAGQ